MIQDIMNINFEDYPYLKKYTTPVKKPNREIVGRSTEINRILSSLERPEVSNAILLGEPGAGKTMIVQGASIRDTNRLYLEVDVALMAASEHANEDGSIQMASRLKGLFDDAERFRKESVGTAFDKELVLFMDEFHQIVHLSRSATQAIKPALADSGTRGIKILAATTYGEFDEYVSDDQALVERLEVIRVDSPNRQAVLVMLENMAKRYNVYHEIKDKSLFSMIYIYTERYVPSQVQPRKSIRILDAMIGDHRAFGRALDFSLLADVMRQSIGANIELDVDMTRFKSHLRSRVFDQEYAILRLESRIQISKAELHDPTRPMGSFLFTGSTGVGKTEMAKTLAEFLFGDEREMIRFDMSEYAQETTLTVFSEKLTRMVWEKPYSVVLFDEIEKAHPTVYRLLLQVLDDARLSDRNGRIVPFNNTYIVATTNIGSNVFNELNPYIKEGDIAQGLKGQTTIIRNALIEGDFPPELLNRFNDFVPFGPVQESTRKRIAMSKLKELATKAKQIHNVDIEYDAKTLIYLVDEDAGSQKTEEGGARGLVRRFDNDITSRVAKFINERPDVKYISVKTEGEFRSEDKRKLKSEVRIIVGPSKRK